MSRQVPGQRRAADPTHVVHVDFEVVMREAVANERWRVLREVERQLKALPTRRDVSGSYNPRTRDASELKTDALAVVERLMAETS